MYVSGGTQSILQQSRKSWYSKSRDAFASVLRLFLEGVEAASAQSARVVRQVQIARFRISSASGAIIVICEIL